MASPATESKETMARRELKLIIITILGSRIGASEMQNRYLRI